MEEHKNANKYLLTKREVTEDTLSPKQITIATTDRSSDIKYNWRKRECG